MKENLLLIALALTLAACDRRVPAPPRPTIQSVASNTMLTGDVAEGTRLYREKQCVACHGATALGGIGKSLANTALPFDQFLSKIRNAIPPKPAMNANDLPEADAYSIYLWLQSLGAQTAKVTSAPAALPTGQILGIQVWVEKGCDQCHGAFAQGSDKGPALAGQNYPFERQRAVMRQFAEQNPAHSEKNIPDDLLQRLLDWLKRGADPASGC
ncbi:S-disulfanyl-L-cysteine oxidoreductase SoxD [Anaerolineae bacterium]|nr:S-disulfanyl-L-cysteine oxidoreductase SoxD [Anaerolineae bacterium]